MNLDDASRLVGQAIESDPIGVLLAKWRRDAFIGKLEQLPDVAEVIPSGILARGTQIGPVHDVDLIVVFESSEHPDYGSGRESAQAAMEHLQDELLEQLHPWRGAEQGLLRETEVRTHVVTYNGGSAGPFADVIPSALPVDVMPAVREGSHLRIPERGSGWIDVDPEKFMHQVEQRQREWKYFTEVVGMVKAWAKHNHLDMKNLAVEVMVLKYGPRPGLFETLSCGEAVARFFEAAAKTNITSLKDPAGRSGEIDPGMNYLKLHVALARAAGLARQAMNAEHAWENRFQAMEDATHPDEFWRYLFGRKYPRARERFLPTPAAEPGFGKYAVESSATAGPGNLGPEGSGGYLKRPGNRADLSDLALALRMQFERSGDRDVLDEAVAASRAAVEALPPDHPDRAATLSNLGATLRIQFERSGDRDVLDEAVAASRAAVEALPPDHPDRPGGLSNLGVAFRTRYEHAGAGADLDAAIQAGRSAVTITPEDHPGRPAMLLSLARMLTIAYESGGDEEVARQAIELSQTVAATFTAPSTHRLAGALSWATTAARTGEWVEATEGYSAAVSLLPFMVWQGLELRERENLLGSISGLASDAAAAALQAGRPMQALELLEHGRGLLIAQALDIRSDLAKLREQDPELAHRMEQVRYELLRAEPIQSALTSGYPESDSGSDGPSVAKRRELAQEWDYLVTQVRAKPDFSNFLVSPAFDQLRRVADQGPVVVLNASSYRCDAFILTTSGLIVVALPSLSIGDIIDNIAKLDSAVSRSASNDIQMVLQDILSWLWDVLVEPVLEILGFTTMPENGEKWPRVWWCPTGPLIFLPIHAASRRQNSTLSPDAHVPQTVIDRVVSSYIPTLRSLLSMRANEQNRTAADAQRMLAVGLSSTPGLATLPKVETEMAVIKERVSDATFLLGEQATRASLITEIPRHSWLHFAGHAVQDPVEPSKSGLLCFDYQTGGPLNITDIIQLNLKDPYLAFLSASATARTTISLADESVHLAAAFQIAGFTNVIATHFEISDVTAPVLTDYIYKTLANGRTPELNPGMVALALHHAVRHLRDRYPATPSLWAPYVHFGT